MNVTYTDYNVTYTDYIELPAPLAVTHTVLQDATLWAQLPTGTTRHGEMWRWNHDLYTITCESPGRSNGQQPSDPLALRWTIHSVARGTPCLTCDIRLFDGVVVTHAIVQLSLPSSRRWSLTHLRFWRDIKPIVRACVESLTTLLHQRMANPLTHPPQTVALTAAAPASNHDGNHDSNHDGNHHAAAACLSNTAKLPAASYAHLRDLYPQTIAAFEQMGALDHLERVCWLEENWERILQGEYDPTCYDDSVSANAATSSATPPLDYDLIYAGSGLGLIHALVMAQCYGKRVLVFDRGRAGCIHREWNISRMELSALVEMGLVTWDELAPCIMREYRNGLVKFYQSPYSEGVIPPSELWMPTVLNLAIDANALLQLMRRKLEAAGGTVRDHRSFRRVRVRSHIPMQVEVELESPTDTERYSARLLLDGMGSTSPLALYRHRGTPFAGLCPTVGTIARGFVMGQGERELDSTIGDILISVMDTQYQRQFIWEGFPGRGDEMTIYVFYYIALSKHRPSMRYSLLELFEQYFRLLPTYKQPGPNFEHLRPVYGYIPGRHSIRRQEVPLLSGVIPVGDSAAQQSPLTYCGFGSHVRNLHRTTSLLNYAMENELLQPKHLSHVNAFQVNVSLHWVFSRFMEPWGKPHNVNEIQNAFLGALNELGIDLASRFFQDRMQWHDYNRIVWQMLRRYGIILAIPWRVLGPKGVAQWIADYISFSGEAAIASAARAGGHITEQQLTHLTERLSPSLGLWLRARYAEWRVMGWLDDQPHAPLHPTDTQQPIERQAFSNVA